MPDIRTATETDHPSPADPGRGGRKMSWEYEVIDGTRREPKGRVGKAVYTSRREAEDARAKLCRMGGFVRRSAAKPRQGGTGTGRERKV